MAAGTPIQVVGHHHRKFASLAWIVANSVAITPAIAMASANAPHACTGSARLLNGHCIAQSYRDVYNGTQVWSKVRPEMTQYA